VGQLYDADLSAAHPGARHFGLSFFALFTSLDTLQQSMLGQIIFGTGTARLQMCCSKMRRERDWKRSCGS
jgi:hypothetical protein